MRFSETRICTSLFAVDVGSSTSVLEMDTAAESLISLSETPHDHDHVKGETRQQSEAMLRNILPLMNLGHLATLI